MEVAASTNPSGGRKRQVKVGGELGKEVLLQRRSEAESRRKRGATTPTHTHDGDGSFPSSSSARTQHQFHLGLPRCQRQSTRRRKGLSCGKNYLLFPQNWSPRKKKRHIFSRNMWDSARDAPTRLRNEKGTLIYDVQRKISFPLLLAG